jgi:serine/threonine-protein kinase
MGGTQFEVLEKRRVVPDLRAVDRRFRPLLEKMLQPNPADRPESMAAVAGWRPEPETLPPPRRTAATLDRGQAARLVAADRPTPQSTLGQRIIKIAIAVALLLGAGGVGFYFTRDFISSPVELPNSPGLDPGPRPSVPGPLPSRERIIDFVNTYDGGDCFFILPETIEDGKATLEGLGSSVAPFDVFDYEFRRQLEFEPFVGVHQVTPEQCPAVSFLSRTKNQRGTAPRLNINTAGLREGDALTGSVAELGDRHVELLLVSDDGYVSNVTEYLKLSGNTMTFSFKLLKKNPGPPSPATPTCDCVVKAAGSVEIAQRGVAHPRTGLFPSTRGGVADRPNAQRRREIFHAGKIGLAPEGALRIARKFTFLHVPLNQRARRTNQTTGTPASA